MKHVSRLIFLACIVLPSLSLASVNVTVNGATHTIPQTNEKGWGTNVTAWIQAISQYTLQNSGGTFTLTAEVDTGATYGFKVPYIKTQTSTPATAGVLRLAKTDSVGFRNNTNSSDLLLAINGADQLTFNGVVLGTASAGSFSDLGFVVFNNSDNTKKIALDASAITTGTTRTLTVPDANITLVGTTTTQTLTNKTLSGNTAATLISGSGTLTLNTSGTITAPNATDTLVGKATTDVLTNKTLSGNTATNLVSGSGTFTLNTTGTITSPNATDTLVGKATTDILTNKSISGSSNTFTNIPATTALSGAVPIANGGTNNASLGVDAGGVYYSDGSKLVNLAHGSSGNVLTSGGTGAPTWTSPLVNPMDAAGQMIYGGAAGAVTKVAAGTSGQVPISAGTTVAFGTLPGNATALKIPSVQKFTSTGTTTGWLFTISTSSTLAVGDTYTNNGNTYTVLAALTAQTGQVLFTSGASAPLASGTLTRASGAGTASITFTSDVALATYTTPSSPAPLYLKVRVIGAGGGGSGAGSATAALTGGAGSSTFFGSNLIVGGGGGGGTNASSGGGGAGGTASLNSPAIGLAVPGSLGLQPHNTNGSLTFQMGGIGGGSPFGSGSGASASGSNNSGIGGGGASAFGTGNFLGSGGGSGAYVDAIINSPSATYVYAIGAGGTAGAAGTSGTAGGAGGSGYIIVEEHYQ